MRVLTERALKKQIIFHIGFEKTGTTSLQHFCHENHAKLLAHGVLYPRGRPAYSRFRHSHARLVGAYLRQRTERDIALGVSPNNRAHAVRTLRREIERSSAAVVFISAEHLSSRFCDADVEQLAVDFMQFDCVIAATVRRHDAFAYAAYNTAVKAGAPFTIDEYLDYLALPDVRYARFAETLSSWRKVFGKSALRLFSYDDHEDMIGPLLGLAIPGFSPVAARRRNSSVDFGAAALSVVRRFNRDIFESREFGPDLLTLGLIGAARWRLTAAASQAPTITGQSLRASAEAMNRFRKIAELDQACLSEEYGVDVPAIPAFEDGLEFEAFELAARAFLDSQGVDRWTLVRVARHWGRMRDRLFADPRQITR